MTVVFASMEQLKSRVWDTRDELVKELKRNGFAAENASYKPAQMDNGGKWFIAELDPDASQEVQEVQPPLNTGKKKSAVARIKAAAPEKAAAKAMQAAPAKTAPKPGRETLSPAQRKAGKKGAATPAPAPPPAKEEPAKGKAKAAPKKAAAKHRSSPAEANELPAGFDEWAVAQATRPDGLLRTEIKAKVGFERRWMPYLTELAKETGHAIDMRRDGRFTRFVMTKAKAKSK
jgi:hypothetical protein